MSGRVRFGWVLLFMAIAAAAVIANASSRRIFILHEGQASHPASRAFFAGADSVLKRLSHLKARHQFLGVGLDACRAALVQMKSFDPDAVVAEGMQARHCIARREPDGVDVISEPTAHAGAARREAFVATWARVLGELSSHAGPITLLHGNDAEGLAERDILIQAAALAGIETRSLGFEADSELNVGLEAVLGQVDNLVVVGHTVGHGAPDGKDTALRATFAVLHTATSRPVLATRLDFVFLGADMALDQAPEQRGEEMAYRALGVPGDIDPPPLEMAVALHSEFAVRMGSALPSFYLASARLSGFLATP